MTISPLVIAPAAAAAADLVKVYGSGDTAVYALGGVTATFATARFTAIMGPSGSGKSTLMHCLAGLDTPTSGSVRIGTAELTAEQNIRLPLDLAGRRPEPDWWDQVIGRLGLAARLGHRPSELSGGQQQRVACARALITRPDVVFADEPTGNLDSASGAEVLGFLRASVRELGQTVIMVTHDPVAASYADRVVFLADGRVSGELHAPTPRSVLDHLKRAGE